MNWQFFASNTGLHRSHGSNVPGHDEVLPSAIVQPASSESGLFSRMNFTNRSGHEANVASRLGAGAQAFGVATRDAAGSSHLSRSPSQSLGTVRPVPGGPTDMGMDMDLEEDGTENQDSGSHNRAPTELSIHTPTTTVTAASSPYQEGFAGGFGTAGLKSLFHPTSPRSPVGAWWNTCGDPGVATSRVSGLPALTNTTQALQAPAASAAPAAGKERRRMHCEDCGSVVGRWGAVKKAERSLGGKSCGSCGGNVAVERESESSRRREDWGKTFTSTAFTSPSPIERVIDRGNNKDNDKGSSGKGSSKDQINNERRKLPSGMKAIPLPSNEYGGNHGSHGNHSDHGGLLHCVTWASQEAHLPSADEDERHARKTKHKRGREEDDSEPAAPPPSADSRFVGRSRSNDLVAPMPRLSWGQSGDHGPTRRSRTASSGSVGGGAGAEGWGGGGGRGGGEDCMTVTSVETRSDPPSDRVSKRRKSDQSQGDSSSFKVRSVRSARSEMAKVRLFLKLSL